MPENDDLLVCSIQAFAGTDGQDPADIPSCCPDDELIYQVSEIFSSLADSTRLKILTSLLSGEMCVCELVELCKVSQSAVSHQFRLLRDRGLVRARRDGQRAVYSLDDDHVRQLIEVGLEHAAHRSRGH
ncbi:MAG: metalloregulator ArsR/SmtB family transcription factor [Coriobacteriales bacterium]|jgi:ArsR family transcriptional regulator|nr:metalloregulator ArsR/SmtB family transcription factor [Coriobacteriales bacterium]